MKPPRRFRRHLLLPPGWLALGGLLWLGCMVLGTHWRQLRQERVVRLTMPVYLWPLLKNDSFQVAFLRQDSARLAACGMLDYSPFMYPDDKQAATKLARMRPWRNFYLTANHLLNVERLVAVRTAVRDIQADSSRAGGVRVAFGKQVPYAELVALLDMMNQLKQHKYWFDIRYQPAAFYAITKIPGYCEDPTAVFCETRSSTDVFPPDKPTDTYWQQLEHQLSQMAALIKQPAWRLPWLLLAVLTILSIFRLVRPPRN
ncbi:MAG: hypothetical protein ACRYFX_26375 [Janthinobacterium lividum]